MPDLHAKLQGGRYPDVARVVAFGAARVQLSCGALPERVSLQRHTCADRRQPGPRAPEEHDRLPDGRVHVNRALTGRGAWALPDVPDHAHRLHEVSPPLAGEQAGDTGLPQRAEGCSEDNAINAVKLNIFL